MLKKQLLVVGSVVGACLLAGCETVPPVPTRTGKPDVTIQASKTAIFDAVTNELLNAGYMLRNVNETKDILVYFIHYPSMLIVWEEMPVDKRVTVNLVQTPAGVRMLGDTAYVAYPGTGREHVVSGPGFSTAADNVVRNNHTIYNLFLRVQRNLEADRVTPEAESADSDRAINIDNMQEKTEIIPEL